MERGNYRADAARHLLAGAALAAFAVVVLHAMAAVSFGLFPNWVVATLVGTVAGVVSVLAFVGLTRIAEVVVGWISVPVLLLLGAAGGSFWLLRETVFSWPGALLSGLLVVTFGGPFLLGCGLAMVFRPRGRATPPVGIGLAATGTVVISAGVIWFFGSGSDPYERQPQPQPDRVSLLGEDPAARGPHEVQLLTYGSGNDSHRPEYGEDVDVRTLSVDLSAVLPEWRGFRATHREWWWGFGVESAPLNGRLWLPETEPGDRRPVALIVHGNHRMDDFSDAGYEYLGSLLASHGIVAASVDANFLNGTWSGDFGGREMPARAILLLEHLRFFRERNRDPRSAIYNRLDLDRVALIGHSRGGEAAAIATAFNDLPYFPDQADFEFDYGFGIESVVAIAQIDRRYSRRMELRDVNFLALQGSYDTDEPSFHGLRQFHRTRLDGSAQRPEPPLGFRLKAGLVAHRANHGQFNTTWGMDSGLWGVFWLNRAPLLTPAEQQRIAAVYIAAFLRATLLGEERFVPLLRDYRAGRGWLPETLYQSQYADSRTRVLAGFEEDLHLETASVPGGTIEARGFAGWNEEEVLFRDGSKQATSAVRLRVSGDDDAAAEYVLRLAEPVPVRGVDDFVVSAVWKPAGDDGAQAAPAPLAMTVQLLGPDGAEGPEFRVADAHAPEPPFEVQFLKSRRMNLERYRRITEEIPQTISIPAARLLPPPTDPPPARAAPAAAPEGWPVVGIRFRFDPGVPGEALLDDVGFRSGSPAPAGS